jgi:hypothetical protein
MGSALNGNHTTAFTSTATIQRLSLQRQPYNGFHFNGNHTTADSRHRELKSSCGGVIVMAWDDKKIRWLDNLSRLGTKHGRGMAGTYVGLVT